MMFTISRRRVEPCQRLRIKNDIARIFRTSLVNTFSNPYVPHSMHPGQILLNEAAILGAKSMLQQ